MGREAGGQPCPQPCVYFPSFGAFLRLWWGPRCMSCLCLVNLETQRQETKGDRAETSVGDGRKPSQAEPQGFLPSRKECGRPPWLVLHPWMGSGLWQVVSDFTCPLWVGSSHLGETCAIVQCLCIMSLYNGNL